MLEGAVAQAAELKVLTLKVPTRSIRNQMPCRLWQKFRSVSHEAASRSQCTRAWHARYCHCVVSIIYWKYGHNDGCLLRLVLLGHVITRKRI